MGGVGWGGGVCSTWRVCIRGGLPRGLPNPGGAIWPTRRGIYLGGLPDPGVSGFASGGVCMGGLPNLEGDLHPGGSPNPSPQVCLRGSWADPSPPMNQMTHRCKNITLPQTSFAGDN